MTLPYSLALEFYKPQKDLLWVEANETLLFYFSSNVYNHLVMSPTSSCSLITSIGFSQAKNDHISGDVQISDVSHFKVYFSTQIELVLSLFYSTIVLKICQAASVFDLFEFSRAFCAFG